MLVQDKGNGPQPHVVHQWITFCLLVAPPLSRGSAVVAVAASAEPALGYITVWHNADLSGLD